MDIQPNYRIERLLGSGTFGKVLKAIDKNNKIVAIKRIPKYNKSLSNEYKILKEIKNCDYVVKLLDFFYTKNDKNKLTQNIVMDFMPNNLENIIRHNFLNNKYIDIMELKYIIFQVLKGLENIHSKGIMHRDIKPENILINFNNEVKICDFGTAKHWDNIKRHSPYICSRFYRAPELFLCVTDYNYKMDIWSVGCIIFEMVTNNVLFRGPNDIDQLFLIFKLWGGLTSNDWVYYKKNKNLNYKLLEEFPYLNEKNDRKKCFNKLKYNPNLKNHDLNMLKNLLNSMLKINPEDRLDAKNCLKSPFFREIRKLLRSQK